jgi:hypothetical protein
MILEGHATAVEARKELGAHGYSIGFSSPGRPGLWAKLRAKEPDHRAIAQVPGEDTWSIVPYPKPAGCKPPDLPALAARDKACASERDIDNDLSFLL